MNQQSPYQREKAILVDRLVEKLPYPKRWFNNKPLHVLQAIYNKGIKKQQSTNKRK